ncbi:ANL_collapsed_G0056730.mRNA.1.CDS.1 [Saccharomyces cerevisiae]|nr:BCN_G0055060.mRNA.1.CDS.1 [Saccharomyces cerevisiae]CAI6915888.1 ANL_collapsed_G0056730.mRNA.1.CDS.1 [Saccharomyces cerevisiae]CAI6917712.1 ANM_collapsed_G0057190.mRNA.1.CDS.1 [Saccharomyces cerevisiae]CAI7378470.1 BCN_G0055060.mRNA.1.CDS.1 [Saccharomyces cerevisiae]CAI7381887.1 AVN_collapsed_G0055330.mRNA.1.CDS.1 [Saccharomyces cerevisiae]
MHRTYSLRNQRAPTAAELQAPPPPPSSTKSKFFGKASIASSFRKNAAGNFGPELARKLSQLVKTEKGVLRAMEVVASERREAAKQLSLWGADNDDDVSDVTDKLGVLIYELGELQDQFIDKYDQYRVTLKSIRNIEASVQPSRDRKEKITDEIAHLKYKDPQSTKIPVLEQELVRAEAESLVAEAQLSNITREKLKAAYSYMFDSLRELSEKFALIAGYGKALLELLDDSPVTPGEARPAYDGYEASRQIIMDAESALESWTLDMAAVKPTLSFHQTVDDVYEDEDGEEEEEEPEIQNGDVPGQVVEEEEVEWTTEVPVDDEAHEADHHVSQNGHTSGSENI